MHKYCRAWYQQRTPGPSAAQQHWQLTLKSPPGRLSGLCDTCASGDTLVLAPMQLCTDSTQPWVVRCSGWPGLPELYKRGKQRVPGLQYLLVAFLPPTELRRSTAFRSTCCHLMVSCWVRHHLPPYGVTTEPDPKPAEAVWFGQAQSAVLARAVGLLLATGVCWLLVAPCAGLQDSTARLTDDGQH